MLNLFVFSGNLARDPRYTPASETTQQVCNFTVGVNGMKHRDGSEGETLWIDVSIWGKRADACRDYLHKGSLVEVNGMMLPPTVYVGKNDDIGVNLRVRANDVQFVPTGKREPEEGNAAIPDDKKKAAVAKLKAKQGSGKAPAKATAPANTDDSGFTQVDPADLPF